MRAVVQTVSEATVTVEGDAVGKIKDGLLVLVGATHDDTEADAAWLARKIWQLRIMDSDAAASDVDAPILVVSQFTLYADTRKGRRPSYMDAAGGDRAEPLVEAVVTALRDLGATVETGLFGAYMRVSSVNVGPRTILLER